MTINLGPVPSIVFVADANTPDHLTEFANVYRLLVGPGVTLPPMGQFETLVISGVSVPGYLREKDGQLEWLMQPAPDPAAQALDAIPGVDGWPSAPARETYRAVGAELLARGNSLAEVQYALTQLYQGAVSNFVAAHPQA